MSSESNQDNSDLNIFLFSSKDEVLEHVFRRFRETSLNEMKTFVYLDVARNSSDYVDPVVSISAGDADHLSDIRLFDWLAINFAQLKVMRVITLLSDDKSEDIISSLISGSAKLRSSQKKLALHLEVQEYRVFSSDISGEPPRKGFFEQGMHGNLVVIPLDSSVHGVVSRPVVKSNLPMMVDHISTEIATIFCLWREMDDEILGTLKVRSTGNADDVFIRFVSSRVSILKCPPLPVADLISASGDLPTVNKYFPAPEPEAGLKRLIPKIYPQKLVFETEDMPDGIEESVRGRGYVLKYVKDVFVASLLMPKYLFQGLQSEVDEMSGIALQEAVGGNESTIKVLFPTSINTPVTNQVSPQYINSVIEKISEKSETPVLDAIGANTWKEIVSSILSVVDGSESGSELRRALGDEKFLLTSRSSLGPAVDKLDQTLVEIYGIETSEKGESINQLNQEPDGDLGVESLGSEQIHDATVAVEQPEKEVTTTSDSIAVHHVRNLLTSISEEIANNIRKSRERAGEMLRNLNDLPNKFGARNVEGISTAVNMAVLLGISILYLTLGTVTPARYWLSLERLTPSVRELLWALSSTVVFCIGAAGLFLRAGKKWQSSFIAFTSLSVLAIGAEVVFFDQIRNFISKFKFVPFSELIGIFILIAVIAVVLISASRNRLSNSVLRRKYSNLVLLLLLVHVVIGVTAYLGQDQSILQKSLPDSRRLGLAALGLVFSLALLVTSAIVVGVVIVRERHKLNKAALELDWCIDELHKSADAQRRLNAAKIQWLGTAAVVARVLQLPLGAEASRLVERSPSTNSFSRALKCDVSVLNLSVKGEQALSARVRQLFIRDGWLTRQYSIMIEEYRNEISVLLGLDKEETKNESPENCPAVPSFEDVLKGDAMGGRWSFLKSVYGGRYDEALIAVAGEVPLSSAYSNVVNDRDTHNVGDAHLTIGDYLGRLIPKNNQSLPGEVVSTLFVANDDRQKMDCYVWWPSEFIPVSQDGAQFHFKHSKVFTPRKLNSWVNVLGSCVLVSGYFPLKEVGSLDFKAAVAPQLDENFQDGSGSNGTELL